MLLLLLGCPVSGDDLSRQALLPVSQMEGPTPPPASSADEDRLFQLLYAGEYGAQAHAAGQRVRVAAWLAGMELGEAQTAGLRRLVDTVWKLETAAEAERAALDAEELARFGPIYAELEAKLKAGRIPEAELADFARRLAAERAAVEARSPAAARRQRVRTMLDAAATWISGLDQKQQERLVQCRFFLARRSNPLGNVNDDESLVGVAWDGGDFSSLDTTGAAPAQPHMDIGGLWAVERMRAAPGQYLQPRQRQAILVMAAQEPALAELLGVR